MFDFNFGALKEIEGRIEKIIRGDECIGVLIYNGAGHLTTISVAPALVPEFERVLAEAREKKYGPLALSRISVVGQAVFPFPDTCTPEEHAETMQLRAHEHQRRQFELRQVLAAFDRIDKGDPVNDTK